MAGELAEALSLARQVAAEPDAQALDFARLGSILTQRNDPTGFAEAVAALRRAVDLRPDQGILWNEYGIALSKSGAAEDAAAALRKATALSPDIAEIHNNLANVMKDAGELKAAAESYREAIRLKPDYAIAHGNLGVVLQLSGQTGDALAAYETALRLDPGGALFWTHYGTVLAADGRLAEAENAHRRAVGLNPTLANAYNNLGIVLKDRGQLVAAREAYAKSLELDPGDAGVHSNLLMCLCYDPDADAQQMVAAHKLWADAFAPPQPAPNFANTPQQDRRLKIGYVSPDLRNHSVSYFVSPFLRHHDRTRFEIYCYSDAPAADGMTNALRDHVDVWLDCVALNTEQLYAQIQSDGIDILIDLAGHTANNRLPVFARRAAPVQMTWMGYGATTGIPAMDYVIGDEWVDPAGQSEAWWTEEIIRLENGFMCYAPPDLPLPPEKPDRSPVTFGSFNNLSKINAAVIALWANVLHAVPHARLILKSRQLADAETAALVKTGFTENGISADRLTFLGRLPAQTDHLALYGEVDIALDTFPYNGATTTCEALYMGVPVLTLLGERHVGRFGYGFLDRAGFPDWVARSEAAFVDIAKTLADRRPPRQAIRDRVVNAKMTDGAAFTKALESAYLSVWARWCGNAKGA